MKHTTRTYIGLGIVFALSMTTTFILPVEEALKGIASLPAIGAMIVAVYQIFRDQASFEKDQRLQRQQQIFSLGTTSHMANMAFDKHVDFCEQYMKEVHETVVTLFREGPTEKAFKHVARFVELQRQYAAWIPKDVALALEPFENALNKISALSHLVEALRGTGDQDRSKAITEMYSVFREVMHIDKPENIKVNSEIAVEEVKERIRSILGIDQLTKMRRKLVQQALESLENDD